MQNYKIPRTEILKLYESSLNEVSAHSIGQWLKVATNNEFVVVPRLFVLNMMQGIQKTKDINLNEAITNKWNFEEMKDWL